jgi:S-adenosylmethionine-diacylglycerol 3-amino-3-carboxypropyl transferase
MGRLDPLSRFVFSLVHGHHLVYNTCWEDPRLDRAALDLGPNDTVVMITSAGCNALDYALDEPAAVHAVDLNPRQNALLELKQAGIRALSHADFFELFGSGRHRQWPELYRDALRPQLSPETALYWDRCGRFFHDTRRGSFYYYGTTGLVAWMARAYLDRVAGARSSLDALLHAGSVDEQRDIYDRDLRDRVFRPFVKWVLGRNSTLALLAVPAPQRDHLERDYPGGIAEFIVERVSHVSSRLPIADNYFWRVYLQGRYSPDCCPEYLTPTGFARLKSGLVDRITTHTQSVEQFLTDRDTTPTALVLLDHMDWLSGARHAATLRAEWQAIVDRAAPGARIIWRSGGVHTRFVDAQTVRVRGHHAQVGDLLTYAPELTARLHATDRVHTYGSFHRATLAC